MSSLRKDLFLEYGLKGLESANKHFREEYTPKKEGRFNFNGITYEYGPLEFDGKFFQFEVSSKIPQDKIVDKIDLEEYFEAVKQEIFNYEKKPLIAARENIVRGMGVEERKERDYVKARYCYMEEELYSKKEFEEKLAALAKNPKSLDVPVLPGIVTPAGRLIIRCIEDGRQKRAKEAMVYLIEANEKILKKLDQ